jgi:hypothetical protein
MACAVGGGEYEFNIFQSSQQCTAHATARSFCFFCHYLVIKLHKKLLKVAEMIRVL